MKTGRCVNRRRFLQDSSALAAAGSLLRLRDQPLVAEEAPGTGTATKETAATNLRMRAEFGPAQLVWIMYQPELGMKGQLASKELARGLRNLGLAREPIQAALQEAQPGAADIVFTLQLTKETVKNPEAFEITQASPAGKTTRVQVAGATPQAVLYAVFDFLERQGAFFGLDGEIYPLEAARALKLPPANQPWQAQPRFAVRGLSRYPAFLNDITVYNREDFRANFEAMLRMRFNTLGMHVYAQNNPFVQPFLSFEYAGAGHSTYPSTSTMNRWGYLPERTSHFGMGSADYYDGEVFGAEAATQARGLWESQELVQQQWAEAFRYAQQLGIRTGLGFDPYEFSDDIFAAVPPEAYYEKKLPSKDAARPEPRLDPESVAARDILEARLGKLLETYPMVDYVWIWDEREMSRWATNEPNVPLSLTPFKQAHSFLKRHAPGKRLVLSGWGGVVRHFKVLHQGLPEDIIFCTLSPNCGWDPVSEEYAQLGARERWPMPWLEDDLNMWFPQFNVYRFAEDMDRAEKFGCQGLLAPYWRNRTTEATAGFQSHYSWDKSLRPADYYRAFAAAHVRPPRAESLAKVLDENDRDRRILCGVRVEKDGSRRNTVYSCEVDEGFSFWTKDAAPSKEEKESTAEVARSLRAIAETASSPAEYERLNYVVKHIEFLVPYAESLTQASQLHQVLQQALEIKRQGKHDEARQKVMTDGVPLWLKLAPLVREGILAFQRIASTRDDLGTLASMHNKYERLALFRLRASMKEFLGELPPEVEKLFAKVRQPEAEMHPRLFVPTRPTLLRQGERVRITAIAPGRGNVAEVKLFTRVGGAGNWVATAMKLLGRRTFVAELETPKTAAPLLDYYVQAQFEASPPSETPRLSYGTTCTAPLEAPNRFYTVTLL